MANTKPPITHEDASIASLKRDPGFAIDYLNAVLADGERGEQLLALRRMAEAFGGVAALAGKANLNPKTLYRTLSANGNPELRSLSALLGAMGLRLAVQPAPKVRTVRTVRSARTVRATPRPPAARLRLRMPSPGLRAVA